MATIEYEELHGTLPLNIIFTHSKKKLKKLFRKLGVTNYDFDRDNFDATTSYVANGVINESFHVVYMRPNIEHSAGQDAGILAHEATHVAQDYFESIGESKPSPEFEAYVVGRVTEYLCEQHWKWKRKRLADS